MNTLILGILTLVIQVTKYKCEICNEEYLTNSEAQTCEAKGTELPLAEVGNMIKYEVKVQGGFPSILLDLRIKNIEKVNHFLFYTLEANHGEGVWVDSLYDIFGNAKFRQRVVGFSF